MIVLTLLLLPSLVDPDYYWHIEAGRLIVTHLTLPNVDPFSFTRAGQHWVLHEWLFQVLLYGSFSALGPLGPKILTALLGTASIVLVYATANKLIARQWVSVCLAGLLYVVLSMFLVPRPQLFTYLFVAAYLYILVAWKYKSEDRLLPALPMIMVVWVNTHGGYMIGIALLVVFCVTEWLLRLAGSTDAQHPRSLRTLGLVLVLTILGSLINPYFIELWAYPLRVTALAAVAYIAEWQSPDFNNLYGKLYLLLVAGFCVLQIYRRRRPDLTELALPGIFIVGGFVSVRHVVLATIVMAVFAAAAGRDGIAISAPKVDWLASLSRNSARLAPRKARSGRLERAINLIVLLFLCAAAIGWYPVARAREAVLVRKIYPVDSVQFILDHGVIGRMFNNYGFGGYLIHRLYPQQRVFIDGRADMYGDDFFKEYAAISSGARNWQELFDKYRIDFVVCARNEPIRQLLLTRGDFRLVFEDAASSVLVKNDARFSEIPSIASE